MNIFKTSSHHMLTDKMTIARNFKGYLITLKFKRIYKSKGAFSIYVRGGGRSGGFAEDANFFDPPSVLTSNVDHPNHPPSFGRVKLFMPPLLVDRALAMA